MERFDHILIGHGLAGAALERELSRRGARVLVVDRGDPRSTSRVAAGLVTPVTGKRFVASYGWREFWPLAVQTYGDFLHRLGAVRLFQDEVEREAFEARREGFGELVGDAPPLPPSVRADHGAFAMPDTGRLDTTSYLAHRRDQLRDRLVVLDVPPSAIELGPEIRLRSLDVVGDRITFCEGFSHSAHPLFRDVGFRAAKGEILTVRAPDLDLDCTVHTRGFWMTPLGDARYRVGATYEWDELDHEPTSAGRRELLRRLAGVLSLQVEVLDHVAGVRPIVDGRQPLVGVHPRHASVGYINGLGSKGALLAPAVARMYVDSLEGVGDIDPEFDLARRCALA